MHTDAFNSQENLYSKPRFVAGEENANYRQYGNGNTHSTAQELCFVSVLENFIRSAEVMQQTVLFPSFLMDSNVSSVLSNVSMDEIYLDEKTDLRTFCLVMTSLKTQITEGCSYIEEGIEESIERRKKVQELCTQLRPLIRQAKYLGYAAEEIALCVKPVPFQEFIAHESEHAFLYDDHSTCNLLATLKMFLQEMDEMEEETLFPSLLKSHSAVEYGCGSNEEQTLNDLYLSLIHVKRILLHSQGVRFDSLETSAFAETVWKLDNSAFAETVWKLKNVFYNYTTILERLVVIYLQKVPEEY